MFSNDKNDTSINSKSRYGDVQATQFSTVKECKPEDVPVLISGLRNVFRTEKTYSAEWRKKQLQSFKLMLTEKESELCQAMFQDLHKSPFEGFATELALLHHEIDHALDHLDEWMTPEKKGNSALNIPCWATTQRDPLGVCLVLGAWNYPMQLSLAPMIGAIIGGNCVIMKPGSYACASSNALARIIPRYLDNECIKVVEGNRHVTTALLAERFDHIFFTGSAFVGKLVARAAAEHLTPVVLELGGKSPCIVDKHVNIEHAAKRIVWAKFLNCGQTCVACDFMMVHADIADKFLAAMKRVISTFYGPNAQTSKNYGRLINVQAFQRLEKLLNGEKKYIHCGGNVDASERYMEPTIIDFGTDMERFKTSDVMQDELFGPILPVIRYHDLNEQVIEYIKELPTGKPLALYAYSNDHTFINTIKQRTTSGGLVINDSIMHLANGDLPFGGIGASGLGGGYHGKYSFNQFTHEKAVLEKMSVLDNLVLFKPLLDMRFPPYTSINENVVRLFGSFWMEKIVNLPVPAARLFVKMLAVYLTMRITEYYLF